MFWQQFRDDESVRRFYLTKIKIIQLVREYFFGRTFQELEAPLLNKHLLPESYVDVFVTHVRRRSATDTTVEKRYLPTSPEAFQKKMMAGGIGNNFTISKSFRNSEPMSKSHQPEFTLLEWYEVGADLAQNMHTTQKLVEYIHQNLPFPKSLNVPKTWQRLSVREAVIQYAKVDLEASWDREKQQFSLAKLLPLLPKDFQNRSWDDWDEVFDHLILTYVEPSLPQESPVILYNYPRQSTPLAKPVPGESTSDELWAGRFELYWGGYELCDAYWEQTDAEVLKKSFMEQQKRLHSTKDKTQYPTDEDFLAAIKAGIPECSGTAFGLDRLALLHSQVESLPTID